MSETKREAEDEKLELNLSGKQKALLFGAVLLAWSGGGDRGLLLREGGLFMAGVLANLFALNLMECYFDGAWYAPAAYAPVLAVVLYFLATRLLRIAAEQIASNDMPAAEAEEDGGPS